MAEQQTIKMPKNLGLWISIAVLLITQLTTYVLMKDQVMRNKEQLEKYPPAIFAIKQAEIAKDVDEIKSDVKDLIKASNEFFMAYPQ